VRNLNKPPRYNVASIQAQQTLGGDVMQSDENGNYVEWRDYQWLLTEKQRLDAEVEVIRQIGNADFYDFLLRKVSHRNQKGTAAKEGKQS